MTDHPLLAPRDPLVPIQTWLRASLVAAINDGRLPSGQKLPPTRAFAAEIGVARNTVTAVYEDLVAKGWLTARERRGYFVGDTPPAPAAPPRPAPESAPDWDARLRLRPAAMRHIVKPADWRAFRYPFCYGQVDPDLFPIGAWRACARDAMGRSAIDWWSADRAVEDDPMLIEQLRRHVLPQRGVFARADEVMITLGSQHGIYLVARLLLGAGAVAAVEDPGYPDARNIFRAAGAELRRIPVDAHGLTLGAEARAALKGADLALVTPGHHCPTMATMPADRRAALLDLARGEDLLILEDDYEGETRPEGAPPALKAQDRDGRVIHLGTMSKVLAPGMRIGWLVAPAPLVAEARALRRLMHRSAPLNNQRTAAVFIEGGHYQGLVRGLRGALEARWAAAASACDRHLEGFRRGPGQGGSSLWLELPGDLDGRALIPAAAEAGVLVESGDPFMARGREGRFIRLGLSSIDAPLIEPGIKALAAVAAALRG
ncbi:PLP-dependent aminotransferase family protein [Rhodovulum sp. DZ06]|uniref:aminotransferase-like domain-containing protein n=1 Tax=Rhodovulum sp. DZ06 TaxID=3425126 RepID=UPI003D33B506